MAETDPNLVLQALTASIGLANVSDDIVGYSIDGVHPGAVAYPRDVDQLADVMSSVWRGNMAVAPWGGGTRIELGNRIRRLDAVIDLRNLDGIVHHNAADLTATVESGITIGNLQKTLAAQGQFLAIDPPLPDRATVGGTLATGISGPLKWQYGNPRDLVIGMKVVRPDGKISHSGGRVVKNVSGYDMARLHVGGLGTLGVVAEVSFKLTPLPRHERTLVAAFHDDQKCLQAGLDVFHSDLVPLSLVAFDTGVNGRLGELSFDGHYFLSVRLGGRPLTLERQTVDWMSLCRKQGAADVETLDEARSAALWRGLTDFGWNETDRRYLTARALLLPTGIHQFIRALERTAASGQPRPCVLSHPGYGTCQVNWFGDGSNETTDATVQMINRVRGAAHQLGGRLIIERCPPHTKSRIDVWDDVGEPMAIMRRMKDQYDPKGILNPGRYAGGI